MCCMEAEGRDMRLAGGSGGCMGAPVGPYSTGCNDSDPPSDSDGGLDSLLEKSSNQYFVKITLVTSILTTPSTHTYMLFLYIYLIVQ